MNKLFLRTLQALMAAASICAAAHAAPTAPISEQEAYEIGVEAYVYSYPLVTMETMRRQVTNVPRTGLALGRGPMNTLVHFLSYPDSSYRDIVRPNFDTLYSMAWLDLSREPLILTLPASPDRYYLVPLLDMWTDVFASPGTRTTGKGAHSYALTAPGWHGKLPAGVERIAAPSSMVMVAGRTQTNGVPDYDAVHAFQDGMRITPLSRWGKPQLAHADAAVDAGIDMKTPPMKQVNAMPAADFYRLAAALMGRYGTHATDEPILARMQRIGLEPGKPFDLAQATPEVQHALQRAAADGLKMLPAKLAHLAPRINGWMSPTENFGVYGNSYLMRAAVALVGLGANSPEDAVYALTNTDANSKPLNGNGAYTIHFSKDELPPVRAFWSLTVYDREGFPVPNPLGRYALGDRDHMKYDSDGSLTIYMQSTSPGADLESNWIPTPAAPFTLAMRLYYPLPAALTGAWQTPGVQPRTPVQQ